MSTNHNLFEEEGEPKRYRTEVFRLPAYRLTARPNRLSTLLVVVDRFYIALFSALEHSLRSRVILLERLAFYSAFLNIHRSGALTALAWLVPRETAAVSPRSVYTVQPCIMSLYAKPHT